MHANQRTHTAYLAELDREPIGMAWLAHAERVPEPAALSRRTGDLQSMYVLPAHRGQGVGTRLIQAVITAAATFGLEALSVRAGRRSLPLYKRLGFTTSDHVSISSPTTEVCTELRTSVQPTPDRQCWRLVS